MPAKAEQCATCIALALATATAIISASSQPDKMHQISQWLMSSTGFEAAAIAGAIDEDPDVLQAP
jgi:hypothetical protein